MKKRLLYLLTIVWIGGLLAGQSSAGILEFFTDELELEILDASGEQISDVYFGMELNEGDRIKTYQTNAELRLDPNGTIIRLAYNTDFTIEALQRDEGSANSFALLSGKIRTIAARSGLFRSNYSIRTPTAVAGVRGTDFGMEVIEGMRDAIFVAQGRVDFTSLVSGETLEIGAGMTADVFADIFQAIMTSAPDLEEFFSDLQFEYLDTSTVPSAEFPIPEESAIEEESQPPQPASDTAPPATVPGIAADDDRPSEPTDRTGGALYNWLSNYMNMQIGTLTIDGVTYANAVLQPELQLGKLRLGLYLPIIYTSNMFDKDDWYKPDGNDEWSFGTDQEETLEIARDVLRDLMLKIKYLEYGGQRDPFYLRVGNLGTMTIGHGILMNNYANDIDFPAVRRVGLNTGINASSGGVEAVINDLAQPTIFGGRAHARPAGKLGFGISVIADISPSSGSLEDIVPGDTDSYGDPIFMASALDLDYPLIETSLLSIVFFSDIGAMVPYYRNPIDGMSGGWALKAVYDDSEENVFDRFRNWGVTAGVLGNITLIDYRLEYRHFNGTFRAPFFGSAYERLKGLYVLQSYDYLSQVYNGEPISDEYTMTTRGIYGSAGFNLLNIVRMEAGYFLPWDETGFSDRDNFHLLLSIPKGAIPLLDISATLSYDRDYFVEGIKNSRLIDEYTVIQGELVYPVSPIIDLAVMLTSSVQAIGPAEYTVTPVISIETRISF